MSFIELNGIEKIYNQGLSSEVKALKGINLKIEKGQSLAIIGRSGSGKSTLLHILGCLDYPTAGSYILDGQEIDWKDEKNLAQIRNQKIGFVFQEFGLMLNYSVWENVAIPLLYNWDLSLKEIKDKAIDVLDSFGLVDLAYRKVAQLSGGQKQRVAIARAVANSPELILADEPTGSLDSETEEEVLEVLAGLRERGCTVIIVTHDERVARWCEWVVKIHDGLITEKS
ncbi:hypothetical protein BBF96_05970 [Anoxybacter fermentans]|uniref:ABC transporter domain-containing protein n=1 Tax=Anoxybacter fermentans TaxID=1323375 RepID=A0A3S9SXF7_9FIRM|nr:ABC transporter ATP-binding protein [Anoxybacter fermentans]AZR72979.1 hypothetical protein BBF96_05970 [Anoxybacter fermentans]